MKKRIAFSVPNINDAISYGANTLVTGDYALNNKRYLYVLSGENDKLQLHDGKTEEIKKYVKEIFCDSIEGRELDSASYNKTPVIFMVKRDSNGVKTLISETEIVAKLKRFRKENLSRFKPYVLRVDNDGVQTQMLPIFGDDTVFTYISFDGVPQTNIGMVTETLLERFTNTENNLTTQVMLFYDRSMELAHRVHLADVNQDAKIINVLSNVSDFLGYLDAVEHWIPETKTYAQPPKSLDIDLRTSDRSYMYKYKLEDISNDKIPYIRSGLKLTSTPVGIINNVADTKKVFSNLESSYNGGLHNMLVSHSITESYIVSKNFPDGFTNGQSYQVTFPGNPKQASKHVFDNIGDSDNRVKTISGSLNINCKTDIPKDAVFELPWIVVSADCYSVTNGEFIKKVNATFANGSWKYSPNYNEMVGNKAINFTINLSGYYKVRLRTTVFWGRFGAWTDEIKLSYFGLDRGNDSGGIFSVNDYIFNGQSNRIITKVELIIASKYEKSCRLNGKWYYFNSYQIGHGRRRRFKTDTKSVNPNITWEDNAKLYVPWSANWWYANFYGKIYEKDGCNMKIASWENLSKISESDASANVHYGGVAQNQSLLNSIQIRADFRGDSTTYETKYTHIPFIYPALEPDHTFMVRGGNKYTMLTNAITPKLTQIGVQHIDRDTFGEKQDNTFYTGGRLITDHKIVVGNTFWELSTNADVRAALRSAPREVHSSARRRRSLMMNYYPPEEKGLGALYNIQVDNTEWHSHEKYFLILNCKDGSKIEIEFARKIINSTPYLISTRDQSYRVYVYRENDDVRIITYGINAKVARLGFIDDDKMFITLTKDGKEYRYKLYEEGDIPFNIGDKVMYLKSEEFKDPEIEAVSSPDVIVKDDEYEIEVTFNSDVERPEILVRDSSGRIISRVIN